MSTIATYLDRPIAFQRAFVALGAGITGALLLSQAVYWSRRSGDDTGWFFKTQVDWEEETGLRRAEQETARKRLLTLGVMEEDRKGIPAKLYFRVNFEKLEQLLTSGSASKQDCGNPANKDAEKQQTGSQESGAPDCGNPANRIAGKSQTKLRKTTTETTAETTADISSTTALAAVAGASEAGLDAEQRKEAFAALCRQTWEAYANAYFARYQTEAVRNGKGNKTVVNLVERLGAEAPDVARFFVERVSEAFVVRRCHGIGDLLAQCEAYRTQWASGMAITAEGARQTDRTASNANAAQGAAEKAMAIVAARRAAAGQQGEDHAE